MSATLHEARGGVTAAQTFVRSSLPSPPARVLEIGAGDGALAAVLAEAGSAVFAQLHRCDLDPGLRDAEEFLIAAGGLPALGARLVVCGGQTTARPGGTRAPVSVSVGR